LSDVKEVKRGESTFCNKSSNYNRCKCEQDLYACVNTVMNIRVPQDAGKFWIRWGAVSCWRRANPWIWLVLLWLVRIDVFQIGLAMMLNLAVAASSEGRPATLTTTPERHASFVDVSRVGCYPITPAPWLICTIKMKWFKKMDSISYVCIFWTIHGTWMIHITFERGGPKFSNNTARALT